MTAIEFLSQADKSTVMRVLVEPMDNDNAAASLAALDVPGACIVDMLGDIAMPSATTIADVRDKIATRFMFIDGKMYTIRTDTPSPGPDYTEDVEQRQITIDPPYCDVERVWVAVPPPETDPRVLLLREQYRQATRAICALAGIEPVDKLEDLAFVDARGAAMQVDFVTTSVLCDNLTYCLFQLYRLDGDDAWSRI